QDVRVDQAEERLFVIENVPNGSPDQIRELLSRTLLGVVPGLHIKSNEIFLGIDPSKPQLKRPTPEEQAAIDEQMRYTNMLWKGSDPKPKDLDDDGLIYYLGTHGKSQPYKNPHDSNQVIISSSSVNDDSQPMHMILNRKPVRFDIVFFSV